MGEASSSRGLIKTADEEVVFHKEYITAAVGTLRYLQNVLKLCSENKTLKTESASFNVQLKSTRFVRFS